MSKAVRFKMNSEQFKQLVNGETIRLKAHSGEPVEFFLEDIGLHVISQHIDSAYKKYLSKVD